VRLQEFLQQTPGSNHLSIHSMPPSTLGSTMPRNSLAMSLGQVVTLRSAPLPSLSNGTLAIPSISSLLKSIPQPPSSFAPHSQCIMWTSKLEHEGSMLKKVATSTKFALLPTTPQLVNLEGIIKVVHDICIEK
jgi:hypothetical protein